MADFHVGATVTAARQRSRAAAAAAARLRSNPGRAAAFCLLPSWDGSFSVLFLFNPLSLLKQTELRQIRAKRGEARRGAHFRGFSEFYDFACHVISPQGQDDGRTLQLFLHLQVHHHRWVKRFDWSPGADGSGVNTVCQCVVCECEREKERIGSFSADPNWPTGPRTVSSLRKVHAFSRAWRSILNHYTAPQSLNCSCELI